MDLSAAEQACRALGIDSLAGGLQLAPAPEPQIEAGAPALVVDLRSGDLPRLRAALAKRYPDDHYVRLVIDHGGAPRVVELTLAELEGAPAFGDGAALYVPELAPEADLRHFRGLVEIIRRLRHPESGCPWDREQTHESLKPHLIEEAYETLAALDADDTAQLREELGDLLLQIVLHARIAEQAGEFELSDVLESISAKLLRRHPHVFGDTTAETADEVARNWDELKREEKSRAGADPSAMAGVPQAMPALAYSQAVLGRAERAGFTWPGLSDLLDKIAEEARELSAAPDADGRREELGDLLFAMVSLARAIGVDAEEALRLSSAKFVGRFRTMEALVAERRIDLRRQPPDALLGLWDEAKARAARP